MKIQLTVQNIRDISFFFAGVFSIYKFYRIRKIESENHQFESFHKIIQDLVEATPGTVIKADRQIAAVYELRYFPRYYDVSERILEGLRQSWSQNHSHTRLIDEINLTIKYIQKNKKRTLAAYFQKI